MREELFLWEVSKYYQQIILTRSVLDATTYLVNPFFTHNKKEYDIDNSNSLFNIKYYVRNFTPDCYLLIEVGQNECKALHAKFKIFYTQRKKHLTHSNYEDIYEGLVEDIKYDTINPSWLYSFISRVYSYVPLSITNTNAYLLEGLTPFKNDELRFIEDIAINLDDIIKQKDIVSHEIYHIVDLELDINGELISQLLYTFSHQGKTIIIEVTIFYLDNDKKNFFFIEYEYNKDQISELCRENVIHRMNDKDIDNTKMKSYLNSKSRNYYIDNIIKDMQ